MSETRKNHLNIDGGQPKEEDDHTASYRPIPESDTDFRTSKSSLSKTKEKVSSDGAEEKLLQKEDEARITTRVDMTDAKYVVGDHRNGDAKIELDANKKQFSGLTKEELLKYADDPFWVRLRWFMFILFWALWLAMLAGAIIIIIQAPKCALPEPKSWYEKGPLVDMASSDYTEIESSLPTLTSSKIEGVFIPVANTYEVLDDPSALDSFKKMVEKAKKVGVRLVVDLIPNYVSTSHPWFQQSENRSAEYDTYFIWKQGKEFDTAGNRVPPNNWVSTDNTPAWAYSENRKEFYLQLHGDKGATLNFSNPAVVKQFDNVLKAWIGAGAAGVRLQNARHLLVNASLPDEQRATDVLSRGTDHTQYNYYRHKETADQPDLDSLLAYWAKVSESAASDKTLFTILESGDRPELFLLERDNASLQLLRPRAATTASLDSVPELLKKFQYWPALKLKGTADPVELAEFAMLLPAAPVLTVDQLDSDDNDTAKSEKLAHLVTLRSDAAIEQGHYSLKTVPSVKSNDTLIALARWKIGHTGYMAIFNPNEQEGRANLTLVESIPSSLSVHHVSHATRLYTNYTNNMVLLSDRVLVPPKSTVILSYVPKPAAEQ